ncbi:MAG: beta strand repeat-containing protein, partial [Chthoniobacterales bacterium]
IANRLEIADSISAGVINVASGQTATVTGILSQTNGTANTTKFGKDGAGVLVFSAGSGTYNGQIQIGQGTVIAGATGALGANTSTSARGIDLGLNVGDTSQANNVALLASNGVTVGQSIYVDANTGGATRTIGLSGSGTNTFSNEIFLGGTVTVSAGTSTNDQVTISGAINNTGGLTKTGAGVLLLSGNNGYTGATTISAGTLRIGANDRISSQSAISIASGATLDMNNFSDNLGPISGSGSITLGTTGALSVTVGTGTNATFSGQITGGGSVTKAGDGQQNLSGSNNYSGVTTVSVGMLELQNADALGNATGNTIVSSGAALKLYSATGISYTAEALSLSGVGVGGADGALRNVGGTNTWNGAITLSGNSRINADNTSSSPASSLTLAGNITGGANVLFLGANGGNLFISGAISGAGASQDTTTTSIYKDGASNLTLSGNNSYSGDTRLVAGSLTVAAGGTLGNGDSDVFISSGATLNVNTNVTVDSVRETGNNNGGVIAIGHGAVLTVDGANKGTFFQDSISGAGGLTMAGSGNTTLGLYGTQSYTGTTTVTGGKLSSGFALATTNVTVTGGEFETTAANILADTASVIVNGGLFTLGGSDTIGALSGSGGTFALGVNALTTSTSANTSFAGALTGSGPVVKQGAGSLTLSGANTATGGLFIDNGAVTLGGGSVAFNGIEIGSGVAAQAANNAALRVSSGSFSTPITVNGETNTSGVAGARTIEFANSSGSATLSGNVTAEKTFTANVSTGAATGVLSGIISGAGGLTKTGDGTLTLSGASANTYSGITTVSAGVLNLNKSVSNAVNGDLVVSSGATLLLSTSNQVGSSGGQTVTLSGGTITRAGGVSETFGALSVSTASVINFGATSYGNAGNLTFNGTYTPSALLTINNFDFGSTLVFKSDLSSSINNTNLFKFNNGGFSNYTWDSGSSTFTITAIPEPSAYLAAAGLLAMFLWPVRRRLIKDAKSILGLRAPARDRYGA